MISIAIDGPSGAGKSTVAKKCAERFGFRYVDTGAIYRTIGLAAFNRGIDTKDSATVVAILPELDIDLIYNENGEQRMILNGSDVSEEIRRPEISMCASNVSAIAAVRDYLTDMQRNMAKRYDVIMDGRDIGTVVLPNAQVKVFLTASAEERANRRYKELSEKGDPSTYEEVLADINQRDYNDTHREIAPLKQAEDATLVDSTSMTIEQAADEIVRLVNAVREQPDGSKKKSELKRSDRHKPVMEVRPITKTHKINPIRQGFYNVVRPFVRFIFKHFFELSYEGVENVPTDGGNIFASNHRSYGDPVFIALMTRVPISYMAKEELFKQNIFFTLLIKAWGAFPVVRGTGDTAVIDTSIEKLESGRNLVIFPEGTRSKDGKVGKGKTGVALIAAVAQTKVVPVGINFEGEKLCRKKKVVVRYGKPIDPAELGTTDASPKNLKILKKEIMNSITELVH